MYFSLPRQQSVESCERSSTASFNEMPETHLLLRFLIIPRVALSSCFFSLFFSELLFPFAHAALYIEIYFSSVKLVFAC